MRRPSLVITTSFAVASLAVLEFAFDLIVKTKPIMVFQDEAVAVGPITHSRPRMTSELRSTHNLKKIRGWVIAWRKYVDRVSDQIIVLPDNSLPEKGVES